MPKFYVQSGPVRLIFDAGIGSGARTGVGSGVFNLSGFRQIFELLACLFPFRLLKERSSPLAGREFSGSLAKNRGRLGPLPVRGQ
jgi:hypothetical protein